MIPAREHVKGKIERLPYTGEDGGITRRDEHTGTLQFVIRRITHRDLACKSSDIETPLKSGSQVAAMGDRSVEEDVDPHPGEFRLEEREKGFHHLLENLHVVDMAVDAAYVPEETIGGEKDRPP